MHRSRLVAALVDVPVGEFDRETKFWSEALGAEPRIDPADPEYAELGEPTPGFKFYVQGVGAPARMHVDIETDDVEAEVARLEALGASRVGQIKSWWVMRDPAGLLFCVVRVQLPEAFEGHARTWP
jgi:Glyoxalase-like domain